MGDRICVLRDGEIQQIDEPLALYDRPANIFVAGFIGSPPMNFFRGSVLPADGRLAFVGDYAEGAPPFTLPLPEKLKDRAQALSGKPLVLGVRPEDVGCADERTPGAILAEIEIAEPMGAETNLYLRAGALGFIARVRSGDRHPAGGKVRVDFDLARAHVFDARTERAL